jgi:hypothetical protein
MRKSSWFVFSLALLFVATSAFAAAPVADKSNARWRSMDDGTVQSNVDEMLDEIIWSDDFEGDNSDWTYFDPANASTVYWATDDFAAASGTLAYRCFDETLGDNGGYNDGWAQAILPPAADLTGVTSATFSFNFRIRAESGNWDGGGVFVAYGADADNVTVEQLVPTEDNYNQTALSAFASWYPGVGNAGWSGETDSDAFDTFTPATFDLSSYADNAYVQIYVFFASDGAYNSTDNTTMYGMIVDDLLFDIDGTTFFADDADGNTTGDAVAFGAGLGATPLRQAVPQVVEFLEPSFADPGAYSGNWVLGLESIAYNFDQYMEGPAFDLPELENPGDDLYLDHYVVGSWTPGAGTFPDVPNWRAEMYDPSAGSWSGISNIGNWGGPNYVFTDAPSTWSLYSESYSEPGVANELAGMTGVKVRFYFYAPDWPDDADDWTLEYHYWDDVFVEKTSLQHDIATFLWIPYPTTVGVENYGTVTFTNNAANAETGFVGVWGINTPTWPMIPVPPYSIDAGPGTTLELAINDPTDTAHNGLWVPGEALADGSEKSLVASHSLATDQITDNDNFTATAMVEPAGNYEIGMGTRDYYGSLSVIAQGTGPLVMIDPLAANADFFGGDFGDQPTFDLSELRFRGYFHSAAGGAPATPTLDFHVYADDAGVPGTELYSGTYDFGVAAEFTGGVLGSLDVSDVAALQGITGPIYVWAQITQLGFNEASGYAQPFPYRVGTDPDETWQEYHWYGYTGDNASLEEETMVGLSYTHAVSVVVTNVVLDVEE